MPFETPDGGYVELDAVGVKPKKKWTFKNPFKKKTKHSFVSTDKMFDDDFNFTKDDFDDEDWHDDAYVVTSPSQAKKVDMTLTKLPKSAGGDKTLEKAIADSRFMGNRAWKCPSKLETTVSALGGVGSLMEGVIETAIGSKSRIKQEVPMSKKRWATFVSALETALVTEPIPVVGSFISPFAIVIKSAAEGKGVGNVVRDAAAVELASLVDGALGALSGGIYSVATEISGQVVFSLTVLIKAHYYFSTWKSTQLHIDGQILKLKQAYASADKMGISDKMQSKYEKHLVWMQRQSKKCAERGPGYEKVIDTFEKKLKASWAKMNKDEIELAAYIDSAK